MIISHRHRFIFIHLHKTAGDAISEALSSELTREDFVLRTDIQAWWQWRTQRPDPRLRPLKKHSPASMIRECVSTEVWEGYFKFGFVRHPVDRVVSLYQYAEKKVTERRRLLPRNAWYLTPPGRRADPLRWASSRAYLDSDSFSEFIRHPLLELDLAMQPQTRSLCDDNGDLLVDFVGTFEHLDADFRQVQERIGLAATPLARRNVSRRPESRSDPLSSDDRAYLVERFRSDFFRFGYPLEPEPQIR